MLLLALFETSVFGVRHGARRVPDDGAPSSRDQGTSRPASCARVFAEGSRPRSAPAAGFASFVARLGAALAPLSAALAAPARDESFVRLVEAHLAAAEAVARSDAETGAERLWREEAGEAAAQRASELIAAAPEFPALSGGDYPALFEALMTGPVVRPPFGRHPRLFLWGLNEAQLQRADRMILGGLNEGVWPPEVASDPWLSRPMRRSFGLPPPERRIGISAHDFAQALGAREVWLTRAVRVEGAPTVASRWLLRLDAVLKGAGLADTLQAAEPIAWARRAVGDEGRADLRSRAGARSRRLRHGIFAAPLGHGDRDVDPRSLCHLRAPRAAAPGRSSRSMPIPAMPSAACSSTRRSTNSSTPIPTVCRRTQRRKLRKFGRDVRSGAALERPGVRAFWWPRYEHASPIWFLEHEAARRGEIASLAAERDGQADPARPGGTVRALWPRRPHPRPAACARAGSPSSTTRPDRCAETHRGQSRLRAATGARSGDRGSGRLRGRGAGRRGGACLLAPDPGATPAGPRKGPSRMCAESI